MLLEKDPFDESKYWGDKGYEQGVSEVINDIHRELTNFWRVLQREDTFAVFQRQIEATPFSQVEWEEAEVRQIPGHDLDVEAAVAFFIRCRQSRAGGFKDFATLSRNRTRRQMNEQASAWWTCVEGLPAVSARLRRVVILNQPALEVIGQQDGPATLYYLDPPYLHETRAATSTYKHEMTEADHRQLLAVIKQCQGKVMLSGYPNPALRPRAGWLESSGFCHRQQGGRWQDKTADDGIVVDELLGLGPAPGYEVEREIWRSAISVVHGRGGRGMRAELAAAKSVSLGLGCQGAPRDFGSCLLCYARTRYTTC